MQEVIEKTVDLYPAQADFLYSPAPFRGFVGGRGAGKSWVGAYDLLMRAQPGRLYLAGAPTYTVLQDATWRTLLGLARELNLLGELNRSDLRLTTADGAEIIGRSADNPERFRGPNLSGAWLDEASQMDAAAFEVTIACLREAGEQGWLSATYTPRGRQHWTYEVFGMGRPDTAQFQAATGENPFLPESFEETIRRQYTSHYALQELAGEYVDPAGNIVCADWFAIVSMTPTKAARVRYWDKACLTAGTMVETNKGPRPIEVVKAGDMVLTRRGYRRVKWAGMTKRVSTLMEVTFSNGTRLCGTHDHRIWTENRGWVELDCLTCNDYNTSITVEGDTWRVAKVRPVRRTRKRLNSTGSFTRGGRVGATSRQTAGIRKPSGTMPCRSTVPSGNSTTDRFPEGSMSTMLTAITTTTPLTTSDCCDEANTADCTTPLNGSTPVTRPRSITSGLLNWHGGRPNTKRIPASGAVCLSSPDTSGHRSSATIFVADDTDIGKRSVPVYDLEVEGEHEFFANGILVHNSTEGAGAYSCGVLMAKDHQGYYFVEDVVRGQWSSMRRNTEMLNTARSDRARYGHVTVWVEQEPGSGGKESAESTVRQLAGYDVRLDRVTGDKVTRFQPFAAQAEARNIRVKQAPWNADYLSELALFPEGRYKDQADATSGAFNKLAPLLVGGPVLGTAPEGSLIDQMPKGVFRD